MRGLGTPPVIQLPMFSSLALKWASGRSRLGGGEWSSHDFCWHTQLLNSEPPIASLETLPCSARRAGSACEARKSQLPSRSLLLFTAQCRGAEEVWGIPTGPCTFSIHVRVYLYLYTHTHLFIHLQGFVYGTINMKDRMAMLRMDVGMVGPC